MNAARHLCIYATGLFLCGAAYGASYPVHRSAANPRILVDQNNAPFLMVGDSPQALIVNLSLADTAAFLADRATNGFNTLWVNLLCVGYTGGRADGSLLDGTKPFTQTLPGTSSYDLATPNETYFAHVDRVIRMAEADGIELMLDPLETGGLLKTALDNGSARCRAYGRYLGKRYKDFPNLIWLNGNDYQDWKVATNDAVITALALGIRDEDTNHLQTIELNYQASSSLDDPNWAPIVGLNFAYTYHPTYAEVLHAYNQSSSVPTIMGEANYEYETNGGTDGGRPLILRMQEYWTMLSGASGQLYGNHYSWPFVAGWQSHIDSPGVVQFQYMVDLFRSRKWYDLVPDQTHTFVTDGYGHFLSSGLLAGNDYVTAALTPDGSLGMAYLPQGGTITVAMNKLRNPVTARWFDPSDNRFKRIPGSPFTNTGKRQFTAPGKNGDGDPDWLLLLEATPAFGVQVPAHVRPFPEPLAPDHLEPGFKFRGIKGWDWTPEQYLREIPYLAKFKMNFLMNCYLSLFASKPGQPFRNEWWKPLSQEQKRAYAKIIRTCRQYGITFCFAVHPQLDSPRPLNPWAYDPARSIGQAIVHLAETAGQQQTLKELVETYPGFLVTGGVTGANPVRARFSALLDSSPRSAERLLRHIQHLHNRMAEEFPTLYDAARKTVENDIAWMAQQLKARS